MTFGPNNNFFSKSFMVLFLLIIKIIIEFFELTNPDENKVNVLFSKLRGYTSYLKVALILFNDF